MLPRRHRDAAGGGAAPPPPPPPWSAAPAGGGGGVAARCTRRRPTDACRVASSVPRRLASPTASATTADRGTSAPPASSSTVAALTTADAMTATVALAPPDNRLRGVMAYSYEWAGISWDCEGGPRMVWRHGTCAGDSYARYWGGWVG